MSTSQDRAIAQLWTQAVKQFEDNTKVPLAAPSSIGSVDQLVSLIEKKSVTFQNHRHNGTKTDRVRSFAAKTLFPIQSLSETLQHATKLASHC